MFPVEYEARVWNECKGQHGEEEVIHGITFGEGYVEAMENIEKWYGDELISIKMYMLEEASVPIYEFEQTNWSDMHGMIKLTNIETYSGY